MQKWMVAAKKADFKAIGEKFQIDQVVARIIRNRDVVGEENIRIFLEGGSPGCPSDEGHEEADGDAGGENQKPPENPDHRGL